MNILSLHFLRPWWFLGLIPLVMLLPLFLKNRTVNSAWESICDAHLLRYLWRGNAAKGARWPYAIFALAWFSMVLALTGPTWEKLSRPVYRNESARVIVFSLSNSQWATDIVPSRLERSRYKLMDILKKTTEGQTALIAYAGEPYVVSPLTQDANTLSEFVTELSPDIMPVQGHDLGRGLTLAEKLLKQAGMKKGNILVITADNPDASDNSIAQTIAQEGYTISVLGVGTQEEKPVTLSNGQLLKDDNGNIVIPTLSSDTLKAFAKSGKGDYHEFTSDDEDLNALLVQEKSLPTAQSEDSLMLERWRDTGRWFILPLIPLLLLGFRRGWLRELLS